MGDDEGEREGDDGLDRLERERAKGGKLEKWCKGVLRGHKKVGSSRKKRKPKQQTKKKLAAYWKSRGEALRRDEGCLNPLVRMDVYVP